MHTKKFDVQASQYISFPIKDGVQYAKYRQPNHPLNKKAPSKVGAPKPF